MTYIKSDEFIEIAKQCACNAKYILAYIKANINSEYNTPPHVINQRIANYRRKGLLPLDSGNSVSTGEFLKGSSTLFDADGNIKSQWIKTDVSKAAQFDSIKEAINELTTDLPAYPAVETPVTPLQDSATLYISNDIHFGALCWAPESGDDWDLDIALHTVRSSYDYLFETSPNSKIGIVVDLGDLTEADNFSNLTPKSGNVLATDSRYPKVLRASYEALIYAVNKALTKHELVYFYNIAGNHDRLGRLV